MILARLFLNSLFFGLLYIVKIHIESYLHCNRYDWQKGKGVNDVEQFSRNPYALVILYNVSKSLDIFLPNRFLLLVVVGKFLFLKLQLLGMDFVHLLPVSVWDIHRYFQLCGCIFHDSANVLAHCIKLTTDGIYGITQFLFGSLILLANRLTLNVAFTMHSFVELSKLSNHNCLLFYLVSLPGIDRWLGY